MRVEFSSVAELPPGFWQWPHIDPAREWACKGTGQIVVETAFLDRIEQLRARLLRPLIITSGYRSPEHNARVSSTGRSGPHTTARAVDIRVYGLHALELLDEALLSGFTGFGVKQHGPHAGRFLHLDDLPAASGRPRPYLWSY